MSGPLHILALDLSTHTGWATNCTGVVESGVQNFELHRGESPGMRFVHFGLWIGELLARLEPQVVVYEQAHHRGGPATELCVGLVTRVQENCAVRGIEYRSVHSQALKKHATGKGNASKGEMIYAAWLWLQNLKGGVSITPVGFGMDDNEADALCMLKWALDGFPEAARKETKRKAKVLATAV